MELEFIACPEFVEPNGQRCNAAAEVIRRAVIDDDEGAPVEHLATRCPNNHAFFMPAFLIDRTPKPPSASDLERLLNDDPA